MAQGAVHTTGLKELIRAFNKFDKDLVDDLAMELQEASGPVATLTEQYILSGGGGFPAMSGVDSYYAGMRIGVSKSTSTVWVAPAWRSNKGTLQGRILAVQERFRMEGAVEDKSDEIEDRMGDFLDRLASDWGSHLT